MNGVEWIVRECTKPRRHRAYAEDTSSAAVKQRELLVLDVLRVMQERGKPVTVGDIAATLKLPHDETRGLMRTLRRRKLVRAVEGSVPLLWEVV